MGEGIIGQLSVVSRQFSVVSGYSQRMERAKKRIAGGAERSFEAVYSRGAADIAH